MNIKDKLLTRRLDEDDVKIPGVGTVRVRGLSRAEVLKIQRLGKKDAEAHTMALGLVDPQMTFEEVQQWAAASPAGEMEPVSRRIAELSGIVAGADKSGVPADGNQP